MKNAIVFSFSILFITFCSIMFVNVIRFNYQIAKLNDYHYAMVNEIESSDFAGSVIDQYKNNDDYKVSIVDKTVKDDLRIYQVTTKKQISMPILGFSQEYVKESTAR